MSRWPFSLDLLPINGIVNPTASIEDIRGRLVNTLSIIDGVLQMPAGLPGDLKQAIYNVRFHVVTGIGLIDGALQSGFSYQQPASDVDGLLASVDSHISELRNVLPLWHSWLTSECQQGFGADVPAPMRSRFLQAAAQPVNTGDYVGTGLATLGLYGVSRIPAAFHGMLDNPSVFHGYGADGMMNLPPDIGAGLEKVAATDTTWIDTGAGLKDPMGPPAPAPAPTKMSATTFIVGGLAVGMLLALMKRGR